MGVLYKITSKVNDRVYIGITKHTLDHRKREHLKNLRKGKHCNKKLQEHFNKYGESAFSFSVVLESDSIVYLCESEVRLIEQLNATDKKHGFNLTKGGELNLSTVENIENRKAGSRKQPVSKYDFGGTLIQSFESVKEAARVLEMKDTEIHRACKLKCALYGFRYQKGSEPTIAPHNPTPPNKAAIRRKVTCVIAGERKEYSSIKEAAKETGIHHQSIQQSCAKGVKASGINFYYNDFTFHK